MAYNEMMFSTLKRLFRGGVLLLCLFAGPALGGGGDWKMGPFGPYWDDNSWPEFTPMYWMEEFMNRLDDDDDEIQNWMLRNQFPGQYPAANSPGGFPQSGLQPDTWSRPQDKAYAAPYNSAPGNTYIFGESPSVQTLPESEPGPLPYLSPEEFARMPLELQREFKRAFDKEYPLSSAPEADSQRGDKQGAVLPKLTRQEFARMPADLQHEYRLAYEREYPRSSPPSPGAPPLSGLPNLTPQEYARMPTDTQREYKRAFEREYYARMQEFPGQARRSLPKLTQQEFARMPADLQQEYARAFEQEYGASRSSGIAEASRLPMLTREEFSRMPAELQRDYRRALDRESAARANPLSRRGRPAQGETPNVLQRSR